MSVWRARATGCSLTRQTRSTPYCSTSCPLSSAFSALPRLMTRSCGGPAVTTARQQCLVTCTSPSHVHVEVGLADKSGDDQRRRGADLEDRAEHIAGHS